MESITFRFEILQKDVLNANSLPNHFIVKGKMAAALRALGAEKALEVHPDQERAKTRLESIRAEGELNTLKSRARKRLNKEAKANGEEPNEDEIIEKLDAIEKEFAPETPSNELEVEYPFSKFRVDVAIQPPTRRRFDPPNLYPTVKHIIDGMTDASFWEDDSFDQLVEMSFKGDGVSGISKTFVVTLNISSVEVAE